jgi:hypothetical protein
MSGSQLTRGELEDRLDTLEAAVEDLQATVEDQARERAQDRARITALEEENEDLRDDLTQLQSRLARLEDEEGLGGGDAPSTDWSRARKKRHVQALAYKRARNRGGKAALDYKDVRTLFNEDISDGHCYDLLKLAAGWDEDSQMSSVTGFAYQTRADQPNRLTVDAAAVNDDAAFHAVNNDDESEGVK